MPLISPDLVAQAQVGMAAHIDAQENIAALLEQIAQQSGEGLQTIAVTEQELGGGYEVDFPVEGAKRWLVPRVAQGGTFAIPAELTQLIRHNNRRLGASIVNSGEHAVRLFLAGPKTVAATAAGHGSLWLAPEGGAWDFRLGSLLWCGAVCAIAIGGETTVDLTEV